MRNLLLAGALALATITAGCSGCSTLDRLNQPALSQTKMDEVAYGFALGAGTLLNSTYASAADSGFIADKALDSRIYNGLGQYDALLKATRRALDLGDAATAADKLNAARLLFDDLKALIPTKKAA